MSTPRLNSPAHARHNNGMHPTADTLPVIYSQGLGAAGDAGRSAARVSKTHDGGLRLATARGSFTTRRPSFVRSAALRVIISGAWREARRSEYRGSRQVRVVSITHPNNGLHPTAH